MLFEHTHDEQFFKELLCAPGEPLEAYDFLFDFRPPS